jgi:PAS domain S-box-containing protein
MQPEEKVGSSAAALRADGGLAVLESGAWIAGLPDRLPVALYLFDVAGVAPVFVNRAAERLLGYSLREMEELGEEFLRTVMHPDDLTPFGAHLARAATLSDGESVSFEYRFRRRDGEWRWFHSCDIVFARRGDGTVTHLLGVASDRTERVLAEQRGAQDADQLRRLFASIDEGFCVCEIVLDRNGRPVDYRFLEVNPLFEEMTGLVDPVGRTARELVPDLEQVWIDTYARVAIDGENVRFEQGSLAMGRWFDVFAMPLGDRGRFGIVFKDETARRQAQFTLERAADLDHFRAALSEALRAIEDPTEVQAVAARLLGSQLAAARVLYADLSPDGAEATLQADYHPGAESIVGAFRLADYGDLVKESVPAGGDVIVSDAAIDPRLSPVQRRAIAQLRIGAYVIVPLLKAGRVVAVLAVHHTGPHAWTDEELLLVHETADRTWASVARARAEQTLRKSEAAARAGRERAERTAELMTEMLGASGTETINELTRRFLEFLVRDIADVAEVSNPELGAPIRAVKHRWRSQPGIAARAEQILEAGGGYVEEAVVKPGSRVEVALDLGSGHHATLRMALLAPDSPGFRAADVVYVKDLADRAALIVTRARLREQEHAIAVRLQRALLPDRLQSHPDLVVHAHYAAASDLLEVGGDWYDTFSWPSGHYAVVVGDVMGHDLHAAAAMGRLRAGMGALATRSPPNPSALLKALDRCVAGPDGTEFATAAVVVIDPHTGRLDYACAGHPPPLVITPTGMTTWLEDATSPPLLAHAEINARLNQQVLLEPGSTVLLYSDGLIERPREHLDDGLARLQHTARRLVMRADHATTRPSGHLDLARLLIETLLEEDQETSDDTVVVAVQYQPTRRKG